MLILDKIRAYSNEVMLNMQMSLLPKTYLGWWSFSLAICYILFYLFSTLVIDNAQNNNAPFTIVFTVIGACIAAAAAVTGILSVVKAAERAVFVYLSTVIGIYCLIGCIVSLTGKTQPDF